MLIDDYHLIRCERPDLLFEFGPQTPNTPWMYARCGHVVHRQSKLMLGEHDTQYNWPVPGFGLWDRIRGTARKYCTMCISKRLKFSKGQVVCAVCGTSIWRGSEVFVSGHFSELQKAGKFWKYATHMGSGDLRGTITCTQLQCGTPWPQLYGRWNGNGVLVPKTFSHERPLPWKCDF